MRIVLASNNRSKLAEIQALLEGSGHTVVAQSELGVTEIEETGRSFLENALLKARHAAHSTGLPALADDSGLCVSHLHGAPGLYSARYAGVHGDYAANNSKLLQVLEGVSARDAYFVCVLALLRHAQDPAPLVADGRWHGQILTHPRGEHGFGYDPVFLPEGLGLTAAELPPSIKNTLSHRGQALRRLRRQFDELRC